MVPALVYSYRREQKKNMATRSLTVPRAQWRTENARSVAPDTPLPT